MVMRSYPQIQCCLRSFSRWHSIYSSFGCREESFAFFQNLSLSRDLCSCPGASTPNWGSPSLTTLRYRILQCQEACGIALYLLLQLSCSSFYLGGGDMHLRFVYQFILLPLSSVLLVASSAITVRGRNKLKGIV